MPTLSNNENNDQSFELSFESNADDIPDDINVVFVTSEPDEQSIEVNAEKKKRNSFKWTKVAVGKSLDEAVDVIVEEGFKLYDDKDLKCGQKFYFKCECTPKSRTRFFCHQIAMT